MNLGNLKSGAFSHLNNMVGALYEVDRDSRNSIFSMLFYNVRFTTNIVFRFSFRLK